MFGILLIEENYKGDDFEIIKCLKINPIIFSKTDSIKKINYCDSLYYVLENIFNTKKLTYESPYSTNSDSNSESDSDSNSENELENNSDSNLENNLDNNSDSNSESDSENNLDNNSESDSDINLKSNSKNNSKKNSKKNSKYVFSLKEYNKMIDGLSENYLHYYYEIGNTRSDGLCLYPNKIRISYLPISYIDEIDEIE